MTIRAICCHHTDRPAEDEWVAKGGWAYWGPVLARYYQSKGWTAMPHVFAAPDGWHILWPLDQDGRGVGGGHLEPGLRHVEIVGNYNERLPAGATLNNAVDAAATILVMGDLTPDALTHHTAVVGPGVTECPGAMLIANWTWFTDLIAVEWRRKKMDAQEALRAAQAARFDREECVRLLEDARALRRQAAECIAAAERKEAQAFLRLQQGVNTRDGVAYKPEVLLGGNAPAGWEG